MPARTSFWLIGTRGSRASAQTRRAYVGILRIVSSASFASRGGRSPLATVHLTLRETCPQRHDRRGKRGLALRGPERDQIVRLAVGDAAQLDAGRRILDDPRRLRQCRADLVGADGLLALSDNQPERRAARREAREVDDQGRHEGAVRHDDLTAIRRAEHGRAERDLLNEARAASDLDGVADEEGALDEHPDPSKEVLEDVLEGEAQDDPEHAERGEDPTEGAARIDREDDERPHRDHGDLGEVAEKDRHVRLGAVAREGSHRYPAHRARENSATSTT